MLLFDLFEARRKDLVYKDKVMKNVIERVTVELEGSESSVFSRAAKRYKQMDRLLSAIQEKRNELNDQIKDKVLEYYDGAADEIYTRVIETVSMTATMSKKQADTPASEESSVDYEKVVAELMKLVPNIEAKAQELIKEFTTIKAIPAKPGKSPSLSVKFKDEDDKKKKLKGKLDDMVEEGLSDVWMAIKKKAQAIFDSFKVWGKDFDAQLAKINAMAKLGKKVVEDVPSPKLPMKTKNFVKKLNDAVKDNLIDQEDVDNLIDELEGQDGDTLLSKNDIFRVCNSADVDLDKVLIAVGVLVDPNADTGQDADTDANAA